MKNDIICLHKDTKIILKERYDENIFTITNIKKTAAEIFKIFE